MRKITWLLEIVAISAGVSCVSSFGCRFILRMLDTPEPSLSNSLLVVLCLAGLISIELFLVAVFLGVWNPFRNAVKTKQSESPKEEKEVSNGK
ncbi:hypothetical protein [Bacteroides reticulotermitis]|uniref:hypothetical protein n=1 Tax=Bacteroides reticulotermitis TaxID=1133319 RepID=UPI003A858CC7